MSATGLNASAGVVLYDGECGFCDRSVQFILNHDAEGRFAFAPLQSAEARDLLAERGREANLDSIVLIDGDQVLQRSDAALRIASRLDGWPKLLSVFRIVPRFLRDWAYDLFAANRYRWFGRLDHCRIPTEEQRGRFLAAP